MNSIQLKMHRRQITALIRDDPVKVVFHRSTKVQTSTGAWKDGTEQVLPEQTVALIPFLRRLSDSTIDSQFGEIPNIKYILMGRHDLDVQVGDSFTYEGQRVRIDSIDPFRDIRTSCAVIMYG